MYRVKHCATGKKKVTHFDKLKKCVKPVTEEEKSDELSQNGNKQPELPGDLGPGVGGGGVLCWFRCHVVFMLLLCIECLLRNALLLFMPWMFSWLGVGFLLSIGALAYSILLGTNYFCLCLIYNSVGCLVDYKVNLIVFYFILYIL